MNRGLTIEEKGAALAFSAQAKEFDQLYGPDLIIQYKRERVRLRGAPWPPPMRASFMQSE